MPILLLLIHAVLLRIVIGGVGEPVHRVEEVIFRFVLDERAGGARVGHGEVVIWAWLLGFVQPGGRFVVAWFDWMDGLL